MSGSGTTVSEDITPKSDREYVDNINTVVSDPDSYAGKYIKFYGIVSQTCDEGDDYYIYQAYTDTDYNNSILLKVSKDVSAKEFKEDSFISVDAKITGSYSGQTVMGVDTSWAYMIAADAKETTYIDSFGKADTTWEFEDQSIEQHGITVKVTKVEFAENETRFYVDVTNNSNDNVFTRHLLKLCKTKNNMKNHTPHIVMIIRNYLMISRLEHLRLELSLSIK